MLKDSNIIPDSPVTNKFLLQPHRRLYVLHLLHWYPTHDGPGPWKPATKYVHHWFRGCFIVLSIFVSLKVLCYFGCWYKHRKLKNFRALIRCGRDTSNLCATFCSKVDRIRTRDFLHHALHSGGVEVVT